MREWITLTCCAMGYSAGRQYVVRSLDAVLRDLTEDCYVVNNIIPISPMTAPDSNSKTVPDSLMVVAWRLVEDPDKDES